MNNRFWWDSKDNLQVKDNNLLMCGFPLDKIAKRFGTPLYVYSLDRVVYNYNNVLNMFKHQVRDKIDVRVYYAMKANGALEILEELKAQGAYIDTSSIGEVNLALEVGFPPEKIIFTGTNFGLKGFKTLADTGVLFNIDSFSQLRRFSIYAPRKISIRLNPGVQGVGFNEKFDMSGVGVRSSRLGIYKDRIIEAFQAARDYGFDPICLHLHIGSNWAKKRNLTSFLEGLDVALSTIRLLEQKGFDIQILNLGGGIGVRSHKSYPEFPLKEYFKEITEKVFKAGVNIKTLAIEPGRYIVSDAGVLLATTNMVEEKNGINYIGLDVGFNAFNHKFVYDIESTIINVSRIDKYNKPDQHRYAIVGYLGEQGDVFSESEFMPKTEEDDVLMIYPTGAYCASELAEHHLLPNPKEIFLKTNKKNDILNLHNFCKSCPSSCCYLGPISISDEARRAIEKKTGITDVFVTNEKTGVIEIDNKKGEACHFLSNDGITCTIQDIKPVECQTYPLLIGNLGSVEDSFLSKNCPVIDMLPTGFIKEAKERLKQIPKEKRFEYFKNNEKNKIC